MNDAQKQAKEYAEILLAFSRGEKLEYRFKSRTAWGSCPCPAWQFQDYEYRIAPKPVEGYAWVDPDGNASCGLYQDRDLVLTIWQGKPGRAIFLREVTE